MLPNVKVIVGTLFLSHLHFVFLLQFMLEIFSAYSLVVEYFL